MHPSPLHHWTPRLVVLRACLILSVAAVFCVALPACNTTEGVGKDVKSLGRGIEEAADDAKD